jgi:hypothetical protein
LFYKHLTGYDFVADRDNSAVPVHFRNIKHIKNPLLKLRYMWEVVFPGKEFMVEKYGLKSKVEGQKSEEDGLGSKVEGNKIKESKVKGQKTLQIFKPFKFSNLQTIQTFKLSNFQTALLVVVVWVSLGNGFKRALVGDNGYFDKLSNQEITT